jgi:hypothetical protein
LVKTNSAIAVSLLYRMKRPLFSPGTFGVGADTFGIDTLGVGVDTFGVGVDTSGVGVGVNTLGVGAGTLGMFVGESTLLSGVELRCSFARSFLQDIHILMM